MGAMRQENCSGIHGRDPANEAGASRQIRAPTVSGPEKPCRSYILQPFCYSSDSLLLLTLASSAEQVSGEHQCAACQSQCSWQCIGLIPCLDGVVFRRGFLRAGSRRFLFVIDGRRNRFVSRQCTHLVGADIRDVGVLCQFIFIVGQIIARILFSPV